MGGERLKNNDITLDSTRDTTITNTTTTNE